MSDKDFWKDFYTKHKGVLAPSPFAIFIVENYDIKSPLLELGCGNGRDSLFFAKNDIQVLGIDQCENTISNLQKTSSINSSFEAKDFTSLGEIGFYNTIYSRFTLHSVTKEEASKTLNWVYEHLNEDGLLCIEVRSVNDELYGQGTEVSRDAYVTDHFRRFVRHEELTTELTNIGYTIVFDTESRGLAKYKEEDPSIIRIIARK